MDYRILVGILQQHGCGTYKVKTLSRRTFTKRIFSNPGTDFACEMIPGCRKKGIRIDENDVREWTSATPVAKRSAASRNEPSFEAFRRNLKKIFLYLSESKLWPRHLTAAQNLLNADRTDLEILYNLVNEKYYEKDYKDYSEWSEKANTELKRLKAGDFSIDEMINICRPSGIKAIPYENTKEWHIDMMNNAIRKVLKEHFPNSSMPPEQSRIGLSWRGKYDYSAHVTWNNAYQEAQGFYSEEYHDCGNGYYYIMLDAAHALFVEKD